jgi:hypothetical protein
MGREESVVVEVSAWRKSAAGGSTASAALSMRRSLQGLKLRDRPAGDKR